MTKKSHDEDANKLPEEEPDKSKAESSDIWADPELLELMFASEENRETMTVERNEVEEVEELIMEVPEVQDPEEAHRLYHGTLQPLLRKHLKDMRAEARKLIREQVNLLLKDGHEKGRDGKQGYFYRINQAVGILNAWQAKYAASMPDAGTKSFALFTMFKDKVDEIKASRQVVLPKNSGGE